MVIISDKAQVQISALTRVVDTAVTVGKNVLSAGIFKSEDASYVIVYTGDFLTAPTQIKWVVKIAKSQSSHAEAQSLLNCFLSEQQNAERLLKPTLYTRSKQGYLPTVTIFFTIESARRYFMSVLETGMAYQQEAGCKKINLKPTTVKSLITNLNNAVNNAAANGWSGITYSAES